jgi:hypothetical protein
MFEIVGGIPYWARSMLGNWDYCSKKTHQLTRVCAHGASKLSTCCRLSIKDQLGPGPSEAHLAAKGTLNQYDVLWKK